MIQAIRSALQRECKSDFSALLRPRVFGFRRAILGRLIQVLTAVIESSFPNAFQLSRELGCCPKTIHRDLQYLRSELGLRIEYDPIRHGYFLADGMVPEEITK